MHFFEFSRDPNLRLSLKSPCSCCEHNGRRCQLVQSAYWTGVDIFLQIKVYQLYYLSISATINTPNAVRIPKVKYTYTMNLLKCSQRHRECICKSKMYFPAKTHMEQKQIMYSMTHDIFLMRLFLTVFYTIQIPFLAWPVLRKLLPLDSRYTFIVAFQAYYY